VAPSNRTSTRLEILRSGGSSRVTYSVRSTSASAGGRCAVGIRSRSSAVSARVTFWCWMYVPRYFKRGTYIQLMPFSNSISCICEVLFWWSCL